MKTTRVSALLLALVFFFLTACGEPEGPILANKKESRAATYYRIGYTRFTGEYEANFVISTDANVTVDIMTMRGRLDLEIFDKTERQEDPYAYPIFHGEDLASGSYPLDMKQGSYTLVLHGSKHVGSLQINYPYY